VTFGPTDSPSDTAPETSSPTEPKSKPTPEPTKQKTPAPTEPKSKPTPEPTKQKTPVPPTFQPNNNNTNSPTSFSENDDVDDPFETNFGKDLDDQVEEQLQQTVITFEPPSKVQSRIQEFAFQGGVEFEDPSSYQSAALQRVEEQVGVDDMTDIKLMQYYSLYCIFEATNAKSNEFIIKTRAFDNEGGNGDGNIPGWKITAGWLENDVDPCEGEWYGVACVDDQVVNLDLFDNGLTGNFAPEVVFLAGDGFYATGAGALVALDIFNNEFMSNNGDNSWIEDLGSQLGTYSRVFFFNECKCIICHSSSFCILIQ